MAWEVCPLVRGDSPKWFEGESSPRATVRVGHLPHCECGGGRGREVVVLEKPRANRSCLCLMWTGPDTEGQCACKSRNEVRP